MLQSARAAAPCGCESSRRDQRLHDMGLVDLELEGPHQAHPSKEVWFLVPQVGEAARECGTWSPCHNRADPLRKVVHLGPVFRSGEERVGGHAPRLLEVRVCARLCGALIAERAHLPEELPEGLRGDTDLANEERAGHGVRGL